MFFHFIHNLLNFSFQLFEKVSILLIVMGKHLSLDLIVHLIAIFLYLTPQVIIQTLKRSYYFISNRDFLVIRITFQLFIFCFYLFVQFIHLYFELFDAVF
jgi:hypothetical protein